MDLKSALEAAVADVVTDVPDLAWRARRAGLAARRRRRAMAAVGAVAATALVGGMAWEILPGADGGGRTVQDTFYATAPVDPSQALSGVTRPLTERGVVAALAASVDEISSNDARFAALGGSAGLEPTARFLFSDDSEDGGLVQLSLQPLEHDGDLSGGPVGAPSYVCETNMGECRVTDLASGATLRTYVDTVSVSAAGYRRNVAELIDQARGVRVLLWASASTEDQTHVVRHSPPLTTDQLARVAQQPWWSLDTLPREYVAQGEHLPGFRPLCPRDGLGASASCLGIQPPS